MRTCAIYARYSSDAQKQTSIDDQVRECSHYIKNQGWSVSKQYVFTDEAISGMELNRPGYIALKESARRGAFDCIVVDDLSRFGRDSGESICIMKEFKYVYEVNIVSISDNIDTENESSEAMFQFTSVVNDLYITQHRKKIRRGLKGQVIRGYSAGGRVYGYDLKPDLVKGGGFDKFGRPLRHGVKVIRKPEQAEIVFRMFEMRAQGLGYKAIASQLNLEGVPSPAAGRGSSSGHWNASTVREIIRNEKYIGDWTWNKQRWIKKNKSGKRICKDNPRSEWIEFKDESLRIIPQGLWEKVRSGDQKKPHKENSRCGGERGKYLLSGILACSGCGNSLVVVNSKKYSSYVCNGNVQRNV